LEAFVTLKAWRSIDVALPVTVTVVDGETFKGCLFKSNRVSFAVLGETGPPRRYHWPTRDDRVRADTANGTVSAGDSLTWLDGRDRTVTLTIRGETRCAS
jgi:hypothetical protein